MPSAPTGIGPIEAATIFALSVFAINYNTSVSYAVFSHVLSIIFITLLGLIAMFIAGIDIRGILKDSKNDDNSAQQ